MPQADLTGQNYEISEMLGAPARDSILASEGNNLLLLSEDQGLRQWATATLGVKTSWLQPALLIAKDKGLVSTEHYTKFLVECLNRQFSYVSLDSHALLTQAKADGFNGSPIIRRMLEVLGGKNADLDSNLEVAANFLDLIFQTTKRELLRDRYASLVMDAFCAPRKDKAAEVIKGLTRRVSFRVFNLIEHALWWQTGKQIGTPGFQPQLEALLGSAVQRPLVLPRAIRGQVTEKIRLLGSCFPN